MRSGRPALPTQLLRTLCLGPLLVSAACSAHRGAALPASVAAALEREAPGVAWDPSTRLEADFTYDGVADLAIGGWRGSDHYVVGIVGGPIGEGTTVGTRVWALDFPASGGTQDALCSLRVRLAVEEVDEDAFAGAGRLPPGSRGIALHDDLCDAFHLYWEPPAGRFSWWRM